MNVGSMFRRPQPETSMADLIISVGSHVEVGAQSKDRMPETPASPKWAMPNNSNGSGTAFQARPACIGGPTLVKVPQVEWGSVSRPPGQCAGHCFAIQWGN